MLNVVDVRIGNSHKYFAYLKIEELYDGFLFLNKISIVYSIRQVAINTLKFNKNFVTL